MLNKEHFTLVLFWFMLLTQNLFPQIVLQGTVIDNGEEYLGNGSEPVANALITLTDQADTNRFFSTYTDQQGQYTIQINQTDINDNHSENFYDFRLFQNYPNPFNPSTNIRYELTQPSNVSIKIYNVLGQKIKTLFEGFQSSGFGQIVWNATDEHNQGVPAGVYIYSMKAGNFRINKKMLLIDGQQGQINVSPLQTASTGTEIQHQTVFKNHMSDQYTLQVTGEDIASYEQEDLEITGNMTVDVIVTRTVTDIDGNVYQSVKIGTQWWMAENLKVTHYRNSVAIPNVTCDSEWNTLFTGAYCVHDNNESNADTYGYLYNWYAVVDSSNIAPKGWHVPSDEEWKELEMYLGMSQSEADDRGWRGTDEGSKLKSIIGWYSGGNGTNESGFSALPSGYRDYGGNFDDVGNNAYFWFSSWSFTSPTHCALYRHLHYDHSEIYRYSSHRHLGFSVRLVRD